jgi:ribokinase
LGMVDVLGVGALNIDLFFEVNGLEWGGFRFVPGGEIMGEEGRFDDALAELKANARQLGRSGGGSAANCIYALSRMGFSTAFLGNVGEDEEGDFLLDAMGGVDVSHVGRSGRSGQCLSLLKDGERALLVLPKANDRVRLTEGDVALANHCKVVHMSSFASSAALDQQVALADGLAEDVMVSLDPGERYARRGLDDILPLLRRTDVLFLNDREMRMLTGMGARDGGERLLGLGPDVVVCKSGAKGSSVITEEGMFPIEPVPVKVVDMTGAGDVYAAGFLAGLLKGWGLRRCGDFASLVASRSIGGIGREAYPDRDLLVHFGRPMGKDSHPQARGRKAR